MKFKRRDRDGEQRHLSFLIDSKLFEKLQQKGIEERTSVAKIVEDLLSKHLDDYSRRTAP